MGTTTAPLGFSSHNPGDTEALGERLGQRLSGGEVIALTGPLGAGKTVFVRGLARALGVPACEVASPTYVLERVYAGGRLTLRHLDAYRLSGAGEFEASDLGAALGAPDAVAVIEWADRVSGALPDERLEVAFENLGGDVRRLTLAARGERCRRLLGSVEAAAPRRARPPGPPPATA